MTILTPRSRCDNAMHHGQKFLTRRNDFRPCLSQTMSLCLSQCLTELKILQSPIRPFSKHSSVILHNAIYLAISRL